VGRIFRRKPKATVATVGEFRALNPPKHVDGKTGLVIDGAASSSSLEEVSAEECEVSEEEDESEVWKIPVTLIIPLLNSFPRRGKKYHLELLKIRSRIQPVFIP
jgi:hypothetical protein